VYIHLYLHDVFWHNIYQYVHVELPPRYVEYYGGFTDFVSDRAIVARKSITSISIFYNLEGFDKKDAWTKLATYIHTQLHTYTFLVFRTFSFRSVYDFDQGCFCEFLLPVLIKKQTSVLMV
jgi:hypothetical protein